MINSIQAANRDNPLNRVIEQAIDSSEVRERAGESIDIAIESAIEVVVEIWSLEGGFFVINIKKIH